MIRSLTLLIIAAFACSCHCVAAVTTTHTRRFSVRYHANVNKAQLVHRLQASGYSVVAHFDSQQILAVVHPAHHEGDAVHSKRLAAITGVQLAERDQERYPMFLRTRTVEAAVGCGTATPVDTCKWQNMPASDAGGTDFVPYGINMTQANDPALNDLRSTVNSGVLICVIDTGVDRQVADFRTSRLRGCTSDNNFETGFQCPMTWSSDDVGHGTHVTGTIAAAEDGYGVVGMIPGGADVFHVKVLNDTCDPPYGCYPVYGTNLVEAFQACENHLNAKQQRDVSLRWTMVVSMSLGGAGPVTMEKMYFDMAGQRDDILWVAACGNKQLGPTFAQVGAAYPAGYEEVVAVAAVDCNEQRGTFSQINADVELSGPGVNVVSDARTGQVQASLDELTITPAPYISLATAAAVGGVSLDPQVSVISVSGRLVDCGNGVTPCYDGEGAVCLMRRGPNERWAKSDLCKYSGGVGVVFYNRAPSDPSLGCELPPWTVATYSPGAEDTPDTRLLPSVMLSYDQGVALVNLLDQSESVNVSISIRSVPVPTAMYSGTSMACPHVSGAAARVWSAYPHCSAADVRAALRASAKPLGNLTAGMDRNDEYGFGLVQVKDALAQLEKADCAKNKTASARKLRS